MNREDADNVAAEIAADIQTILECVAGHGNANLKNDARKGLAWGLSDVITGEFRPRHWPPETPTEDE